MTIGELIEEPQKFPAYKPVFVADFDGFSACIEKIDVSDGGSVAIFVQDFFED